MDHALIDLPAREGAGRVALGYLDQAAAATRHLDDDEAVEALHDFRVGMRRLRTCLRAYDSVLGDRVRAKTRRRLKRVASATNPGRDAEVQLDWILSVGDTEGEREKHGVLWLADQLRATKDEAYSHVRSDLTKEFKKVQGKLHEAISTYTVTHRVGRDFEGPRFGDVAADALAGSLDALRADLARVTAPEHETIAHRARIHGKRLRYLLEPFRREVQGCKEAVKSLKALQDLLGDLNDLHNLTATVGQALEASSLERARRLRELATRADDGLVEQLATDHEPGLIAMLRRIQSDRVAMFERLLTDWLAPETRLDALDAQLRSLFSRMREEASYEIERKYLLLGKPPACDGVEPTLLAQGYIPGERLIERLRKTSHGGQTTYLRTMKLGTGVKRIEVEETCAPTLFESLYALTEGRRVHKQRFVVPDGDLHWEVDVFTDRELFVAEIELPSEHTEVVIPEWLAPYVVREVTGESAYVNANLAQ